MEQAARHAYIRSCGMYVPETVVRNEDLARMMDTTAEWIHQRSGIRERRYAEAGVRTSDLAVRAVQDLLAKGEVEAGEIDCIIFATLSPDFFFPGPGVLLQQKLGWADRNIPCYDIRQQCSGFVYGLQMAQAFVETGMYHNVLLVGAELHSHGLDFSDRGRAVTVLFGDGAGAAVISAARDDRSRILVSRVYADGEGALNGIHMKVFDFARKPIIDYDVTDFQENADLYPCMPAPKNLFANAVRRMSQVAVEALSMVGLGVDDVDWVVPHQANIRINRMVADTIKVPREKVLYNMHKYGNTTAATIPLLLTEFTRDGTIKRGDVLLMVAFGSGFTWGAAVARY
ncbi:MAG: ketoacyl-ACP synthase III [Deltaproteobacteria bacterium]|nr:ketoacyl-ACP synthase III [Deltaproteobacteria bacterium]MBW2101370.1 ketoacyl-ACP synthase III [Deltaproteobacteria bacterium]MBW2347931.1 ketoacyl-ACP synthase III [Deltaproteobacteria bacterium]RLB36326.1 MAG: 3-oxoacyl-ACP synthase [Deltaproteobacteria bacterium]